MQIGSVLLGQEISGSHRRHTNRSVPRSPPGHALALFRTQTWLTLVAAASAVASAGVVVTVVAVVAATAIAAVAGAPHE